MIRYKIKSYLLRKFDRHYYLAENNSMQFITKVVAMLLDIDHDKVSYHD